MQKIIQYLPVITAVIGGWALLNGTLHDIFVLAQGRKYDRDTLRLLLDGHILLTCGAMQVIAYSGLKSNNDWAYYVAGIACISLLIYCAMIFPFLKSYGFIILNTSLLALLIYSFFRK